jgi:hypothetical protein
MMYEYDFGRGSRRLVIASPGQPCLCLGLEPALYEALRAASASGQEEELVARLTQALRAMLEPGGTLEAPLAQLQVQRERVQEQLAALDEREEGAGGSIVETDV